MRRRRRNPSGSNWLMWAGLAVGAYVVWKYLLPGLTSVGSAVSAGTNAVSGAIASFINTVSGTSAPSAAALTVGRGVKLPDGSIVPLTSFTQVSASADSTQLYGMLPDPTTGAATMWTISGPVDANGNYLAS